MLQKRTIYLFLIDQNFYTVENTREDTITDDSYFTQWEQDKPEQFNVDDSNGHEIGPVHVDTVVHMCCELATHDG